MFLQTLRSHLGRICLIASVVLLLPVDNLAQLKNARAQAAQAPATSSPQDIMELGLYYYNNDDVSDRAAQSFKQLLSRGYAQSEAAQYFLGAYYQRKFYLQRANRHVDDWGSLKQAATQYRNYTDKFYTEGSHRWLADAFFNLALVYLQLGEVWNAVNELQKMMKASDRDRTVYIYQLTWSAQSQDVIDADLPSDRLADYTLHSLNISEVAFGRSYDLEKTVSLIRKWCQGQRSKAAAQ